MNPKHIEVAKFVAKVLSSYYGTDDLHAMTYSGVEIPISDFIDGNYESVLEMSAYDDSDPNVSDEALYLTLATMLVPPAFFSDQKAYDEKAPDGVMFALQKLGVAHLTKREEVAKLLMLIVEDECRGPGAWAEYIDQLFDDRDRLISALFDPLLALQP